MVDYRKFINSTYSGFIIDWDYTIEGAKVDRDSHGQLDQLE